MKDKEAKARIVINQLLMDAGWRFFDSDKGKANIQLEPNVTICIDPPTPIHNRREQNKSPDFFAEAARQRACCHGICDRPAW